MFDPSAKQALCDITKISTKHRSLLVPTFEIVNK